MHVFKKDATILRFAAPNTKIAIFGAVILSLSAVSVILKFLLSEIPANNFIDDEAIEMLVQHLGLASRILLIIGISVIFIAIVVSFALPETTKICVMVKKALFCYEYGNPLHLKEYELLPTVKCKNVGLGLFELTISATTCTVDDIQNISSSISSSLNGKKYNQYAVTQTSADIAFNSVTFRIEDVTIDKSLVIYNVNDLKPTEPTTLIVQKGTYIDLTTSGSILVSGKTRSGKTTGIICLLLQALLSGRDDYNSEIIIIDPKQAELSRLPNVYTLDKSGSATPIFDAIKHFSDTIVKRQKILNDLSETKGDAVKWWEAGFHISFLFIDEYVACRTMFPKRTSKEKTDYSIDAFDALIKRITTMGASAGCYIIVSIAEASVGEGGIPSMLKSAMTTKILFKPTITEGRLIWDNDKLKDFNNGRVYNSGDAWFSSTDGVHDDVSYVHFPIMKFPVYRELGQLLRNYYKEDNTACGGEA